MVWVWITPVLIILTGLAIGAFTEFGLEEKDRGLGITTGGFVGFILAFIVWICMFGSATVNQHACDRYGRNVGLETQWELVGGCYVQVAGRLVPQDWVVPVIEGNRIRIEILESKVSR